MKTETRTKRKAAERTAESKLGEVRKTLEWALGLLRDNCGCGRCYPCTTGRMRIGKAIRLVDDVSAVVGDA